MRLAVIGTQCIGKTTLVTDFLKEWKMYRKCGNHYRKVIADLNLDINQKTTKDSQKKILDAICKDVAATHSKDNVIFDRCPLDNIVYSIWAVEKKSSDIDEAFIAECLPRIREVMRSFDIVFFLPITKVSPVDVVDKKYRDTDLVYRSEIDALFKAIQFGHRKGKSPFFVQDDSPPIIEIFGSPLERIEMMKLYVNAYGDCVDTVASVLSNENLDLMQRLVDEQRCAQVDEAKFKELKQSIIQPTKKDKKKYS